MIIQTLLLLTFLNIKGNLLSFLKKQNLSLKNHNKSEFIVIVNKKPYLYAIIFLWGMK